MADKEAWVQIEVDDNVEKRGTPAGSGLIERGGGVMNVHDHYVRFMVWLGAAPPPEYEYLCSAEKASPPDPVAQDGQPGDASPPLLEQLEPANPYPEQFRVETTKLRAEPKTLPAKMERLNCQRSRLEQENSRLQKRQAQLRSNVADLSANLKVLKEQKRALEAEIKTLTAQLETDPIR